MIVNEISWTAAARHADIVLPVAAAGERCDFGGGKTDNVLAPMPKLTDPPGAARTEFSIFADLAERLGAREAFTEGLDEEGWLRRLWAETRESGAAAGFDLPDWDAFIAGEPLEFPDPAPGQVFLADFRADPEAHPRATPSGGIEIWSETVAGYGLPECPGHPVWAPPRDRARGLAKRYPPALISGQPATRLHSQMDEGALSREGKIAGREPVLIHPDDAAARGVADGDVVELFNDRGRALAGARVTDGVARGCVFLWTGAWWDPDWSRVDDKGRPLDRHGNPNALTGDERTSEWSQSPSTHSSLVELRRAVEAPEVQAHQPPRFVSRP